MRPDSGEKTGGKCEEAAQSTSSESDTTLPARSSRLSAERRAMVCERTTREKHTGGYDAAPLGPCKVVNEVHQPLRQSDGSHRSQGCGLFKSRGGCRHGKQKRNQRSIIRQTRQGRVETSRGNVKRPRRCSANESSVYATASSRGSRTTGDSFSPTPFHFRLERFRLMAMPPSTTSPSTWWARALQLNDHVLSPCFIA